jgi:hypothetical protein
MNTAQYFYRTAIFSRENNVIALVDIEHPDKITPLEDWMGTVLSLADGRHTISQLISFMSSRYQQAPVNLQETIVSVIERLQEGKLLKMSEKSVELPYYLAFPIEELDIEKAKQLIKEDGYSVG